MFYIRFREINDHLNNNWTNVDIDNARVEQSFNFIAAVNDLRQNGIAIPKTKEPTSLASFLPMFLNILQYGSIDNASTSRPVNPWRLKTCTSSQCIRNQYETINNVTNSPPTFFKQFFNAGPLAIVGVFIQLVACFFCVLTAFIYLPPKPSITCYITPLLIFIAFLFQFTTIVEASHGIHLNGQSSFVFEVALVLQVITIILTVMAADRIHKITNVQCV
ncbi:unnamed protein product [Rotaria sordida]|uniref:Uncharacterized protein n=1 Tax=Rotaria sordida TaxID=392033 RepID=A0A819BEG5_9BILA|nr:unnamed protein product [Rotaria sordida]CAF3790919.1 unnamed protein product [Rotaria sordida]